MNDAEKQRFYHFFYRLFSEIRLDPRHTTPPMHVKMARIGKRNRMYGFRVHLIRKNLVQGACWMAVSWILKM
jgi:hypothetical protein